MADAQTIIELERRFWQSMVDNDVDASIALLADQSAIAGAQGHAVWSHDDYRAMAKQGERVTKLKSFRIDDPKVVFPADGVAIIVYTVSVDMEFRGEAKTVKAADATTWVKRDGKWLAALHTESMLTDTFPEQRT